MFFVEVYLVIEFINFQKKKNTCKYEVNTPHTIQKEDKNEH